MMARPSDRALALRVEPLRVSLHSDCDPSRARHRFTEPFSRDPDYENWIDEQEANRGNQN